MAYDRTDKTNTAEPDRNPDPITGAPGSHPTGTGIGSASGAATGAAIGMLGGPIGAAIGIVAGGIVGGFIGKGVGEKVDPTEDDSYWRESHKSRPYYKDTLDYDRDLSPAYRYGSAIGYGVGDDYDRPVGSGTDTTDAASTTGQGVGGSIRAAGHAVAEAGRDLKDKVTGSDKSAAGAARPSYETHETDIRAGWDKVRGKSNLTYDQARDAIRDAFDRKLQLREERLHVGKERVSSGEATIRKEVVTEHKSVPVTLEREELVIERRPASGNATGTIAAGETIRVPLSEERATVTKDTVVTEEVSIGKRKLTDTQQVEGDVRKERLNVDESTVRTTASTTGSTGSTTGKTSTDR